MGKNAVANPLDQFMKDFATELARAEADPQGYVEGNRPPAEGNPITLGPLVLDPAAWAGKQVDRAKAGAKDWVENSQRPRVVPSRAALAANDKRIDKLNQSIKDKTWEGAMNKVDEDGRLEVIRQTGETGFTAGLEKRKAKIEKVITDLQPRVLALKKSLDAMPEKTDAEREAKMIAAKRGMQVIGKTRKGG